MKDFKLTKKTIAEGQKLQSNILDQLWVNDRGEFFTTKNYAEMSGFPFKKFDSSQAKEEDTKSSKETKKTKKRTNKKNTQNT